VIEEETKMKKSNIKFGAALGALVLVGICVVAAILLYFPNKVRAVYSRPLVLIHEPLNREQISLGDHALVNATARNKGGVKRVELWVDDVFYFAQEVASESAPPTLALMVPWEPLGEGNHTLVVRAISAHDVAGQASIRVWVEEAQPTAHTVEQGETLESIATDYGISEDDIRDENPDMASDGPAAGETIDIPGGGSSSGAGSPPAGGAPAPSPDESPPTPSDSVPGGISDVVEEIGVDLPDPADELSDEPVSVQVEALALQTDGAYEALHCYASMGHLEPQWYPDVDRDQSTDESFAALGDTDWDVAAHLGGDNAPVFTWPGNLPMPFDINCVGITGGGTDSVDLGRVEILAVHGIWDGVPRLAESRGGVGQFELQYRIGRRSGGMGFPTILDSSIPSPFNLRTEGFYELHWDWEPDPEDESPRPIEGFYVYVNNTLQFTVYGSDERSIILPPEWFNPPCGLDYSITMAAWHSDPENPRYGEPFWSYPSDPLVIEREDALEECDITAYVSFDTLTINHYGEAEIGPLLMMMNVNSELSSHTLALDGSCRDGDPGCVGLMLEPDLDYSISWLMILSDDPNYVEVPLTSEGLGLGVAIFDLEAPGEGLICEGVIHIPGEELYDPEGETDYTGTLISSIPDERCQVEFSISSELLASYREDIGYPPLPQLGVEDFAIEDGRYWINVHNYSSGTWAYDLDVHMTNNTGGTIHTFTLPDFVLLPGNEANIFDPDQPDILPTGDLCVTLDPENKVLESVERANPGWTAPPECLEAPDLVISSAGFAADNRTFVVTLENRGDAPVPFGMRAGLEVTRRDTGESETFSGYLGDDGLSPWDSVAIELPVLDNPLRTYGLRTNFSVRVDPENLIHESNESNNNFDLNQGARRVQLNWQGFEFSGLYRGRTPCSTDLTGLSVPYYPADEGDDNEHLFQARIFIENGLASRWVTDISNRCDIPYGRENLYEHNCLNHCPGGGTEYIAPSALIDVASGEWISVYLTGELYPDGSVWNKRVLGTMILTFDPEELTASHHRCSDAYPWRGINRWSYLYPEDFDISLHPWYAGFTLCAVRD